MFRLGLCWRTAGGEGFTTSATTGVVRGGGGSVFFCFCSSMNFFSSCFRILISASAALCFKLKFLPGCCFLISGSGGYAGSNVSSDYSANGLCSYYGAIGCMLTLAPMTNSSSSSLSESYKAVAYFHSEVSAIISSWNSLGLSSYTISRLPPPKIGISPVALISLDI